MIPWYRATSFHKETPVTPEHDDKATEKPQHFEIQIDRVHYKVTQSEMTGAELRRVPTPPLGPDRDLFEVVPGGTDRKIGDTEVVKIRNGTRFFTAPAQINPGRVRPSGH